MSHSQVSLVKNDWLYINDEFSSPQQQDMTLFKMNGVQARRADRKFSPFSKSKATATTQGGVSRIQSVNPSSLWPKTQGSVENWMPRQPSKITSTKPDIDLLFSLFAVIEADERENSDSEQDRSLSPHSSPSLVHSHVNSAGFPVFPSQNSNAPALHYHNHLHHNAAVADIYQQQHQQQPLMASHTPVYTSSDSFAASPSSYLTDEDYSASFDNEVVNTTNYDVMTWLPPVFDNKLMEKAVPFSELVDVFCM